MLAESQINKQELERIFLELQRHLLSYIIGPDRAKDAVDYYEAGGPTGFDAVDSYKMLIQHLFITDAVLGKSAAKMSSYLVKDKDNSEEMKQVIWENYYLFNPNVVYVCYTPYHTQRVQNRLLGGDE